MLSHSSQSDSIIVMTISVAQCGKYKNITDLLCFEAMALQVHRIAGPHAARED
jgi:hypothetical protein